MHVHGVDFQLEARNNYPPFEKTRDENYKKTFRQLAKRAVFIANSQNTFNYLTSEEIPQESIVLKYFGVPKQKASVLENKIHSPKLRLLFLGRLVDFKGPDDTIKAFELACEKGFLGTLTIAGSGPLRVTCEILARKSRYKNRIRLLGEVDPQQACSLYENHDLFITHNGVGVISNRDEAFGVTFIEAMSYGLPVLSTISGAIPESVIDQKTGFLCKSGDIAEQASLIMRIASDKAIYSQLSRNAFSHANEKFTFEKEQKRITEILELGT